MNFSFKSRVRGPLLEEDYARTREELAHERAELTLRIDAAKAKPSPPAMPDMDGVASEAAAKIAGIGDKAEQAIDKVADRREDYAKPLRQFIVDRGVDRPARKSSVVSNTLTLQACFLCDAAATGTLLASDGHMTIASGLMAGTAIAGVNLAAAIATGFFGFRGSRFRAEAPERKPWDRFIRAASAGFAGVGCMAILSLNFIAMRVRQIGDYEGLWDWDKVSFLATFNDYGAIALGIVGVLSGIVGVRSGWGQISDPIWGYSSISKDTERQISEALDQAYDDGAERLDDAFDRAAAKIDAKFDDVQDASDGYCAELHELREDVSRFNTDVGLAVSRLKSAQNADTKKRQYIDGLGRKTASVGLDLAALSKLAIDPGLIPTDCPTPQAPSDALDKLDDAHDDAIGKLDAAYAAASNFITHPFF